MEEVHQGHFEFRPALARPAERRIRWWQRLCGAIVLSLAGTGSLMAQTQALPARADFEQRLGSEIPLGSTFTDETGRTVTLGSFFGKHPVILQLGYNRCWLLCDVVTGALVRCLQDLKLDPGRDFEVIFVSIDPAETWQLGARKKASYVRSYGRLKTGPGWHFLTGSEPAIQALAAAVGFHYFYDPASRQFAHPSGFAVLTPQGRISKYYLGVDYNPQNLYWTLSDASGGTIGSPVEQLLLLCYHWNPLIGRYGQLISWSLKVACLGTAALLAAFICVSIRRDRQQRRIGN